MRFLLLIFLLGTSAHAASPTCKGVVATPAQREAYTQTMIRSWSKEAQKSFLNHHEANIKTTEGKMNWDRLYDEERMAIIQYTVGLFGDLNRALRSDQFNMWTQFTVVCSGLNKLPDFNGWVFRRLNLSPEQISQIKSKGVFSDPAFMSTSKADVLVWKKNTLLKIFTKQGKDLLGVSAHSEEKEVLLLPGSKFKVHRFKENSPDSKFQYEITLKQVNSLDI